MASTILTEEVLLKAKQEYAKLKEGKIAKKLMAIIAYGENTGEEIGKIFMISPRTLLRWLRSFIEEGVKGLEDNRGGNYPPRLTEFQWKEVKEWILSRKAAEGQEISWTLNKLQIKIEERFGVRCGIATIKRNLNKLGIVLRRPRPVHYKSDQKEQESFKKNEGNSGIK